MFKAANAGPTIIATKTIIIKMSFTHHLKVTVASPRMVFGVNEGAGTAAAIT
jgi:hypothetical protein